MMRSYAAEALIRSTRRKTDNLQHNKKERQERIMYNEVLALLRRDFPEIDFETTEELYSGGIIDSLAVTEIVAELSMEFDIEIPAEEFIEENFNSVEAMAKMVERLRD